MPISRKSRGERGSLLIVAMVLCAVIGVSLGSYLKLSRGTLLMSNRALYNNAAMNLAENGLEEAMHAINARVNDPAYAWPGWTTGGGNAWRQFPSSGTYAFDQNTTGIVRVFVYNYLGTTPSVVTRSIVTLGSDTARPIEKWVKIQLRKTSKFANGLVAKQSVTFAGNNASVDSWDSDPDRNDATPAIPYSTDPAVRHALGTVGSVSVSVDAILVQNADIWGYASTGGMAPTVGPSGLVGPLGTPTGTINPNNVSTDFTASFDVLTNLPPPGTTIPGISDVLTLPAIGDVGVMRPDPRTGTDRLTYIYTASSINLNNKALNITKHVIITLTDTLSSIDIGGGGGAINIVDNNASLEIYAPGDIRIAGQGVMNGGTTMATANPPANFQVWGTKTAAPLQDISIGGNGVLSAIVYAPFGSVEIHGNGDVSGSVVANDITLAGNAMFHYDESLGNFGGNNPFRVAAWKELTTGVARAPYSGVLDF